MRNLKNALSIFLVATMVMVMAPMVTMANLATEIINLKVNNQQEPINITGTPTFSWQMDSSLRDQSQKAYRILVSSQQGGGGDLWDSGQVASSACSSIAYEGAALASTTRYYWTVEVWNQDDTLLRAQETWFETALGQADWQGRFIAAGEKQAVDTANYTYEADIKIDNHAAGFIIGGSSASNFVCVQISVRDGVNTRVRVLTNTNGTTKAVYDNYVTSTALSYADAFNYFHFRADVTSGGVMKFYINGKAAGAYTSALATMGGIGFRHFKSGTDDERAYYDNIKVTDQSGQTLLSYHFDDNANPFSSGTVANGCLYMQNFTGFFTLSALQSGPVSPYSVEMDFRVVSGALGILFAATDSRNFLMWQISNKTGESAQKVYLRPHTCAAGTFSKLGDVDVSSVIPWAARNDTHHIKIQVASNFQVTTWIDSVQVDTRSIPAVNYSGVGFRLVKDEGDIAYVDNYSVKNGAGEALIAADFNDQRDPFSTGRTVNGELYLAKCGVFLRQIEQKGAPMFRKSFTTLAGKTVANARLYASSLGIYEAYLNGTKAGDEFLAPGWTAYTQAVKYQSYDVTGSLNDGENVLGAVVGNGWYAGHVGEGAPNDQYWGTEVAFLGQLRITYTDGTVQTVGTDSSWKASFDSPYLVTDNNNGETYDATREQPGWSAPGFDDSSWEGTRIVTQTNTNTKVDVSAVQLLSAGSKVVDLKEITPVSIMKKNGVYIIDMGQNFSGVVRLALQGAAGQTIRLRYGELLYDATTPELEGMVYTGNLRTADATDYYTFKNSAAVTYEPTFTYHGFRYVELAGYEGELSAANIKGIVRSEDLDYTGAVNTGSAMINQLFSNTRWSQISNYLSIPTDCPQRDERLGWTGDAHIFAQTATYNADIQNFMKNYLSELRRTQRANGCVATYAPNPTLTGNAASAGWGDVAVILPWVLYTSYGDCSYLTENYEMMKGWVAYQITQSNYATNGTYIVPTCTYGDWLSVGEVSPKDVVATEFFAYSVSLLAKAARVLGNTADADQYDAIFRQTVQDFNNAYVAGGRITGDTQTVYVLALKFGLAGSNAQGFADRLAQKIVGNGNHLTTGFMGVSYLCPVLSDYGYTDLAYQLVLQDTYPSWGYSIVNGATTIWERWNSYVLGQGINEDQMNSFNHYSYGSVVEWMYRYMGGISLDETDPAYHHILMNAQMSSTIGHAEVSTESVYGTIGSSWTMPKEGLYQWTVTIPANSYATVTLKNNGSVRCDGAALAVGNGVRSVTEQGDTLLVEIGSGTYTFQSFETALDTNGDGMVTMSDPVYLMQFLNGWPDAVLDPQAKDVNGDGRLTIADAVYLLQILSA